MEKMNQVSVSEFFAKSKEEMYDMAVEMVEKYNRLVDICNDSAERMAELMAKDDINEFKKELQSREPGELKIQKLADIVVWADNWIKELKDGLTEEEFTEYIEDGEVRDFEAVKKVVLESMERRTVYSNALNMDIAAKAAKIERMEQEIEGRKKGYYALKEKMDKLKDEVARLNKCIMNKNESINTANDAIVNLRKEIGAHEEENKKLENRISELKKERDKHIIDRNATIMQLEKQVKYLEKELEETCTTKELDLKNHQKRDMALVDELAKKNDEIKKLKESIEEWKNQERIRTNQLRATERKVEELWKEIEKFTKGEDNDHGKSGFKRYIEYLIEEEERAVPERFKERLNEEITAIFTKEEETEVNDIPCGEDAIE